MNRQRRTRNLSTVASVIVGLTKIHSMKDGRSTLGVRRTIERGGEHCVRVNVDVLLLEAIEWTMLLDVREQCRLDFHKRIRGRWLGSFSNHERVTAVTYSSPRSANSGSVPRCGFHPFVVSARLPLRLNDEVDAKQRLLVPGTPQLLARPAAHPSA